MADPILNPGEVVRKKGTGREYASLGRISVWLTLTNQRLIVQRLLGKDLSYPLSHVSQVGPFDYLPPFSLLSLKLLRLDFDNGGSILFGLYDDPAWIQAIEQAKTIAPEMPYTTIPPLPKVQAGQSVSPSRPVLIVLMVLVPIGLSFCLILLTILAIFLLRGFG